MKAARSSRSWAIDPRITSRARELATAGKGGLACSTEPQVFLCGRRESLHGSTLVIVPHNHEETSHQRPSAPEVDHTSTPVADRRRPILARLLLVVELAWRQVRQDTRLFGRG